MRFRLACAALVTVGACASSPLETLSDFNPAALRASGVDPAAIHCNGDVRWGSTLKADAQAGAADLLTALETGTVHLTDEQRTSLKKQFESLLLWRMVRAVLIEGDTNNFGAVPLKGRTYVDEQGSSRPVVIFRTGFTPNPDQAGSCFETLLGAGRVKHVVNLFDGEIPAADLVSAESRSALRSGASYHTASDEQTGSDNYGPWRDLLRKHFDEADQRARAMKAVARLIQEQILAPGGAPPKGNIHVHCGGGMHRTGMIVGVIERCVNRDSPDVVEAHYRRHVGYRDAAHPGGFEAGNLAFIRAFDCALLDGK